VEWKDLGFMAGSKALFLKAQEGEILFLEGSYWK
jgi:hypothetical protein